MQLDLFAVNQLAVQTSDSLLTASFSHDSVCPQQKRLALEERYAWLLQETDQFNRKLVSYQGNKGELVHGWIRYKEGFSAQLVATLIESFGIGPGHSILDPFAGSATTLLALHLHRKWRLAAIAYKLKGRIVPDDEDEQMDSGEDQVLIISPETDLEGMLDSLPVIHFPACALHTPTCNTHHPQEGVHERK